MINCYDTLDEMWLDAAAMIISSGVRADSRDGDMLEVGGYVARLSDPHAHFLFNPVRKASAAYAAGELLWYLSGSSEISPMVHYAPQYKRFSDDGFTAWGAYGKRWGADSAFRASLVEVELAGLRPGQVIHNVCGKPPGPISQVHALIALLRAKPSTRQAVITCWTAGDLPHALAGDRKDMPCTLALNFRIIDGKLNLISTLRSSDLWLGMPYDVFCFTSLQILIAESLNIPVGWYQQQAGSLHVYDRNEDKFLQAASPPEFKVGSLEYLRHDMKLCDAIETALTTERYNRQNGTHQASDAGRGSLLEQCVLMAASKRAKGANHLDGIHNDLMKEHIERCL